MLFLLMLCLLKPTPAQIIEAIHAEVTTDTSTTEIVDPFVAEAPPTVVIVMALSHAMHW